jgi:hypothetical protein
MQAGFGQAGQRSKIYFESYKQETVLISKMKLAKCQQFVAGGSEYWLKNELPQTGEGQAYRKSHR